MAFLLNFLREKFSEILIFESEGGLKHFESNSLGWMKTFPIQKVQFLKFYYGTHVFFNLLYLNSYIYLQERCFSGFMQFSIDLIHIVSWKVTNFEFLELPCFQSYEVKKVLKKCLTIFPKYYMFTCCSMTLCAKTIFGTKNDRTWNFNNFVVVIFSTDSPSVWESYIASCLIKTWKNRYQKW